MSHSYAFQDGPRPNPPVSHFASPPPPASNPFESAADDAVLHDFNNPAPRPFTDHQTPASSERHPFLSPAEGRSVRSYAGTTKVEPELVAVPIRGPDWADDEVRDMTKAGQADERGYRLKRMRRAWIRDQSGGRFTSRKFVLSALAILSLALVIILAVVIPRYPSLTIAPAFPVGIDVDRGQPYFVRAPQAVFRWNGTLAFTFDSTSSIVDVHFSALEAEVHASNSSSLIGKGTSKWTLPAGQAAIQHNVPLLFDYTANNGSDPTWSEVYQACRFRYSGEDPAPGINMEIKLKMHVIGRIGSKSWSASVKDVQCPFSLPSTAQ